MVEATNGVHNEPKASHPLLSAGEAAQCITITITAEDLALFDEVSNGNRSEGVRLALRALRVQRIELKRIKTRMEADPTSVVSHEKLQRRLAKKKAALSVP